MTFAFGDPHLTELIKDCKFPWLRSNIVDTIISKVPNGLREFELLERSGTRVFIGLVEKQWITTVPTWPSNFVYKDLKEVQGMDLSTHLHDPDGPYRCDRVMIVSTHSKLDGEHQEEALRTEGVTAYMAAKTLAEKEVWSFAEADPQMDITTINPPYMYGAATKQFDSFLTAPSLTQISTLINFHKLLNPQSAHPDYPLYIDVRGVAKAHIGALSFL